MGVPITRAPLFRAYIRRHFAFAVELNKSSFVQPDRNASRHEAMALVLHMCLPKGPMQLYRKCQMLRWVPVSLRYGLLAYRVSALGPIGFHIMSYRIVPHCLTSYHVY